VDDDGIHLSFIFFQGKTVLMYSTEKGLMAIVEEILNSHHVDVNIKDKKGLYY
jgi:hypothetical protein